MIRPINRLIENNGLFHALHLGKISGKYKGAGFSYYLKSDSSAAEKKIMCMETISSGVIFEQSAGAYCQKIMQSTYLGEGAHRAYLL